MGRLIYAFQVSLDGYVADADGAIDWSEPDEEVLAFINEMQRSIGTYLYGRRMYETMECWETDPRLGAQSAVMREFADLWQAADKVVYSTTLPRVHTVRTRLERAFDPDSLLELKAAAERDLSVSGPGLAAHAVHAGLVDEFHLIVVPVVLGGGKRFFPDQARLRLDLVDERRFGNGTVVLRYRTAA
jgi:dihydrofolate reductase